MQDNHGETLEEKLEYHRKMVKRVKRRIKMSLQWHGVYNPDYDVLKAHVLAVNDLMVQISNRDQQPINFF